MKHFTISLAALFFFVMAHPSASAQDTEFARFSAIEDIVYGQKDGMGLSLDVLTPVHVFAIGFCMGWVRPSDLAIRNTLVGSMMPPDQLMAAMGISRTTQDSARIAGAGHPAGA